MMLIAFYDHKTRKTRNIFVYAESGKVTNRKKSSAVMAYRQLVTVLRAGSRNLDKEGFWWPHP